jgi:hypothetical protein
LAAGGLNSANWSCRIGGRLVTWALAASLGKKVTLITPSVDGPLPGTDAISYAPPPFDVETPTGDLEAQAFTNYPLVFV